MKEPNGYGVYEPDLTIDLARCGKSYVVAEIAQCLDGRFRFALDIQTSLAGSGGPITDRGAGFDTAAAAKDAALAEAIKSLPKPYSDDAAAFQTEVAKLRMVLEASHRQPLLL